MSGEVRHRFSIQLTDESARLAVEPELNDIGGSAEELVEGGVRVETENIRDLRAALNGWTRLASVASDERLQP